MIYLDNQATTPVDPRVVDAMTPCFTTAFGNAGSTSHAFGDRAAELVEQSRATIARGLGCSPKEIVFTSGATESNNLALAGAAQRFQAKHGACGHLLSVRTEHKAVLDPLQRLARRGWDLTLLDVVPQGDDATGVVKRDQFAAALREDTVIASVMLANNEIGVLQPLGEIAELCRERDVLLHCDATQGIGKLPVTVDELGADLISFSAHKIYGPKGVGGLVVRNRSPRIRLEPLIVGGGQEGGRRSGTLNVPGIVGMAKALELCGAEMDAGRERIRSMRDRLAELLAADETVQVNGPALDDTIRLVGNLNCTFPNVDGEALMMNMTDVAVSSGSACTSVNPEPSHVLRAIGLSDDAARSSLRFGIGRFNTMDEIEQAAQLVLQTVARLRTLG